MGEMPREVRDLLCDPQTSGGLLLAVMPEAENEVKAPAAEFGIELTAIGELVPARGGRAMVEIREFNAVVYCRKTESGARHCSLALN